MAAAQDVLDFLDPTASAESRSLADSVRRFAEKHLRGVSEFRRADFDEMAALGLCGIGVAEEFGGIEIEGVAAAAALFEIARVNLGPAVYLSVHQMVTRLLAAATSNELQQDTLRELAAGKKLGAFCLTEAGAGSDAAALQTRATGSDGGFLLNGEKIYISSAAHADVFLVFAREDQLDNQSERRTAISCFIVPADTPGISIGADEEKMGCEASSIASVRFDNCALGQDARLGAPGEGYRIALSGLSRGRVSIAACACGIAATALEKSKNHLRGRSQFGATLSEFQGLQFMIADMMMLFRASVLLTKDAAAQLDRGSSSPQPAAMAKCFASDAAMRISTDAVQLHGGAGYLKEYGVEQLMRDAKMLQIVEGTNQIQRLLIARWLQED